jgi:hypothetical protein
MMARRKEIFCGDTLNTFGQEDTKFHWSKEYKYYSTLLVPKRNVNDIWTSKIAKAWSVPEFFYATKLVSRCVGKYDKNQRIIQLQGQSPISLAPSTFNKMFRLVEPMMNFKVNEAKEFLKTGNGGWDLLQQYLEYMVTMKEDLSTIKVSQLRKPYQEMAWLFSRVVVQESIATVPRLALYVLYFSIHEKAIFD